MGLGVVNLVAPIPGLIRGISRDFPGENHDLRPDLRYESSREFFSRKNRSESPEKSGVFKKSLKDGLEGHFTRWRRGERGKSTTHRSFHLLNGLASGGIEPVCGCDPKSGDITREKKEFSKMGKVTILQIEIRGLCHDEAKYRIEESE